MSVLDKVMAEINKVYGDGTITQASKAARTKLLRIPTGIPILDWSTGGGIPRGRFTLFRGEESAGKSLASLLTVVQGQQICRQCGVRFRFLDRETQETYIQKCKCGANDPHISAVVDVEGVWTNEWFETLGGDPDLVLVSQPDFGEQIVDVTDQIIRSHAVDLVVVDSLAAVIPSVEIEQSAQKKTRAQQAQLLTVAYRKWQNAICVGSLHEKIPPPGVLVVNQLRRKMPNSQGRIYGDPLTSPGGDAMNKYGPSLVVDLKRKKPLGDEDDPHGVTVAFRVSKNKTFPPYKKGEYDIVFQQIEGGPRPGSSNEAVQVLRVALDLGHVVRSGSWYAFKVEGISDKAIQGEAAAATFLDGNADFYEALKAMADEHKLGRRL